MADHHIALPIRSYIPHLDGSGNASPNPPTTTKTTESTETPAPKEDDDAQEERYFTPAPASPIDEAEDWIKLEKENTDTDAGIRLITSDPEHKEHYDIITTTPLSLPAASPDSSRASLSGPRTYRSKIRRRPRNPRRAQTQSKGKDGDGWVDIGSSASKSNEPETESKEARRTRLKNEMADKLLAMLLDEVRDKMRQSIRPVAQRQADE
ncbi:hypothetical protein BDW74DRAFT_175481 [Aspergillus multicolor]|uniref:uncharacterized protein n=1 Tax=Aspergillus multicolor TaxID=41759 RepID=UPI003CCD2AD2